MFSCCHDPEELGDSYMGPRIFWEEANERTNELARREASSPFTEPKTVLGIRIRYANKGPNPKTQMDVILSFATAIVPYEAHYLVSQELA